MFSLVTINSHNSLACIIIKFSLSECGMPHNFSSKDFSYGVGFQTHERENERKREREKKRERERQREKEREREKKKTFNRARKVNRSSLQ